jgi:hypothetical protein
VIHKQMPQMTGILPLLWFHDTVVSITDQQSGFLMDWAFNKQRYLTGEYNNVVYQRRRKIEA